MLGLIAGVFAVVNAPPAQAVVTTTEDAAALGAAMAADPAAVTGAALAYNYPCALDDCPTGVSDTPMAGFPAAGSNYTILTSGNAALADDPNADTNDGASWTDPVHPFGTSVHDPQTLRVDLAPATGSCLAFDFRFLSEEYPEFVKDGYNDAFVAQLNTLSISANPDTKTVTAPGDFAAGAGDQISVDAAGPSSMAASESVGTTYDGATLKLTARTPVAPGSVNQLYLTVFDQGDHIYDTAVFLDNLRFENIPANLCKSLALDPFEGNTGLNPVTNASINKKKTSMSQTVSCNLPPGPINCNLIAQMVFTGQTTYKGVSARAAANTVMGSSNVSIAPQTAANVTVNAAGPGAKIIKKAKAFPKKLVKKAGKLEAKARKVGVSSKKGQKLIKKAKKMRARAAKLSKQKTLGFITLQFVNPSNGAVSSSTKFKVKR